VGLPTIINAMQFDKFLLLVIPDWGCVVSLYVCRRTLLNYRSHDTPAMCLSFLWPGFDVCNICMDGQGLWQKKFPPLLQHNEITRAIYQATTPLLFCKMSSPEDISTLLC
jgi:hypothetical protein